jgi:transcriptional regulator with GAF, ATPase, and Fis domain
MNLNITIDELRDRQHAETQRLIRAALERNGWRLNPAARDLKVRPSTLQKMIVNHGLSSMYSERNPGAGRPKKR